MMDPGQTGTYIHGRGARNGYERLGLAVIVQAVRDLRSSSGEALESAISFFGTDWFRLLCLGCSIQPEVALQSLYEADLLED